MTIWTPIPGETPLEDLSGFKHIKSFPHPTRAIVNELEAKNILKATMKYLAKRPAKKSAPFDYSWLLKLHKEMFGDVWGWAGEFRTTAKSIGVAPVQIREELAIMLQFLHQWEEDGLDPIEIATRLHHKAVYIHPFENGNGRWSRMLANVWLKLHGHSPTLWPSNLDDETNIRDKYLAAVREADQHIFEPLIQLHKEYSS